jgi:hypothetical protein
MTGATACQKCSREALDSWPHRGLRLSLLLTALTCSKKCREKLQGLGMTEFAEDLRHHCRNPRCRMKLTAPVVNPHKAFCTRGCHSSFYLKRCVVCENGKPAGSTARRKLCRRHKCEGRYRKNSAHYSFLGADTTSAANVPRSAQSTGIKSADFDDRPCYIVAGPKITAAVYHCATVPVDPDIAARARVNAANDLGRIRKEIAWSKRRPPAPKEMQSDWMPCSPSVPVADDLSIPAFLKREPTASPEGLAA